MSKPFNDQRRQIFLTEAFRDASLEYFDDGLVRFKNRIAAPEQNVEGRALLAATIADFGYHRLSVRYTDGSPIAQLRADLAGVITAYERYQEALALYEQTPQVSPLGLDQLGDYERCMQLVGLCILLHRPDLLARLAALVDPGYKGEDTLYEDLLSRYLPDRVDLDEWYHDEPFSPLVQATYTQDKGKAIDHRVYPCERVAWAPDDRHIPQAEKR